LYIDFDDKGFALMAFPIALMMSVTAEWSYYVGMIFIGISWNLAFTGGSSYSAYFVFTILCLRAG
jgi:hypothetical protein